MVTVCSYRSGTINLDTMNSKFHLIRSNFENLCQIPIISCLQSTVNSNTVDLKFHQFKVNLTVI